MEQLHTTPETAPLTPWGEALRQQLAHEYLVLKAVLSQLDQRFTSLANRAPEVGLTEIARSAARIGGQLGEMA
jgi:hypothetical protein